MVEEINKVKRIDGNYNLWKREDAEGNLLEYLGSHISDIKDPNFDTPVLDEQFHKKYKREIKTSQELAEAIYLDVLEDCRIDPEEPISNGIGIHSDLSRINEAPVFITNDLSINPNGRIYKNRALSDEEMIVTAKALDELLDPHYQAFANRVKK